MRDSKLEWLKFDVDSLPQALGTKLDAYREAEATANALKAEFISAFTEAAEAHGLGAPKGKQMIISLKFRDVSIAYTEKGGKSTVERIGFDKPKGRNQTLTPKR
jgi:hypothetical protein